MPGNTVLESQIAHTLKEHLIPWATSGAPFTLLSAPPANIGTNVITEHAGSKLSLSQGRNEDRTHARFWRQENLNSIAVPYMGCVVEGEADITLGTTTSMCSKFNMPGRRWILQATQRSFFLAPPHHPISSGGGIHWERARPEKAYSRIFWMQFYPTGVECHFCTSDKGKHWSHPPHFIPGTETFLVAKQLIREMTEQKPQYLPITYLRLGLLLNAIVKDMHLGQQNRQLNVNQEHRSADNSENTLQMATSYIEEKMNDRTLSVEEIAGQVQFSSRHFARLFKHETQMTVMEYVFRRRMELAAQLLEESTFTVRKVAQSCGYVSSAPFIKAFQRHFAQSPSAYRETQKPPVRFD